MHTTYLLVLLVSVFSVALATDCSERGFTLASGSSVCQTCPGDFYLDAADGICKICSFGEHLVKGTPISCASGQFAPVQGLCESCPPGFTSEDLKCVECAPGNYIDDNSCEPCDGNYYCPGRGAKVLCPSGFVPSDDRTTCEACKNLQYASDNECTDCEMGIPNANHSNCESCPDGYQMSESSEACIKPPHLHTENNKFVDDPGFSNSVICEAGTACANGDVTICTGRKYAHAGASACIDCKAPFAIQVNDKGLNVGCAPCPAGQMLGEEDTCEACPAGSAGLLPGMCISCEDDMYQSLEGQTACQPCDPGSYTENDSPHGNTQCTQCPAGYYCPNGITFQPCPDGYYSPVGSAECLSCGPLKYLDEDGNCQPCENGYASADGLGCIMCDDGLILNDNEKCMPCPDFMAYDGQQRCVPLPGFKLDDESGQAIPCPVGEYCPGSLDEKACNSPNYSPVTYLQKCLECPDGFVTDPAEFPASCTPCKPGTAWNAETKTCDNCPEGFYSRSYSSMACEKCGDNQYTDGPGQAACLTCPEFTTSVNNVCTLEHTDCGEATWNGENCICPLKSDYFKDYKCLPCPSGFSCDGTGVVSECVDNAVAPAGSGVCKLCANPLKPNNDHTECVGVCPDNAKWADGQCECINKIEMYNTVDGTCVECPSGCTCDGTSDADFCEDGMVSAPGASSCKECSAYHVPNADFSACVPLVACGSDAAYDGTQCICHCHDKVYRPETLECHICPAGSACDGSATVVPCEDGMYAPLGEGECLDCPFEVSIDRDRCVDPDSCGDNAFFTGRVCKCWDDKQMWQEGECLPCPPGFSCDGTDVTSKCPKFTASPLGSGVCTDCKLRGPTFINNLDNSECVNSYCGDKAYFTGNVCVCVEGISQYYVPSTTSLPGICALCPAGSACDGSPLTVACEGNTFSTEGMGWCGLCPDGTTAVDNNTACEKECDEGAVFDQNRGVCCCDDKSLYYHDDACLACPSDSICDGCTATPCPAGSVYNSEEDQCCCVSTSFYFDLSAFACTECPPGHECDGCAKHPIECEDEAKYVIDKEHCCCSDVDDYYDDATKLCTPCPSYHKCDGCTKEGRDCGTEVADFNFELLQCCCHDSSLWFNEDETSCKECPEGLVCNGCTAIEPTCPSDATFDVEAGQCCCSDKTMWYNTDELKCQGCPPGRDCNGCIKLPHN